MEVVNIPTDQIEAQELVRSVDEQGIQDLVVSIKDIGILQPLLVAKHDQAYKLIAGQRRLIAARRSNFPTVPCIILRDDHEYALQVSLHENLQREDLNTIDEAQLYAYLRDQLRYSNIKIAKTISKSEGYVSQRLELLQLHPKIIDALRKNQIGFAVAREISRVDDKNYCLFLLKAAIDEGVNYRTAANWVRAWKASKMVTDEPPPEDKEQLPREEYQPPKFACVVCGEYHTSVELIQWNVCPKCDRTIKLQSQNKPQSTDKHRTCSPLTRNKCEKVCPDDGGPECPWYL